MRISPTVLILLASFTVTAKAQSTRQALARADSAWASGDRNLARVLYSGLLAADSTASRAVFRLAQLELDDQRALVLYRRYILLEPDDAWGHMAEGDLLARMGRVDEALAAYEGARAIAPGERDVTIGRARLLNLADRPEQAADELSAWTASHPDDGEAWDLLGRAQMRTGRPRAAASAFGRADETGQRGARNRMGVARAAAAPTINPEYGSLGDSDGNRTTRLGGSVDVMASDGIRVGAGVAQHTVRSDVDEAHGTELDARVSATPSSLVRLSVNLGVMRYTGLTEEVAVPGPGPLPGQGPGPGASPRQNGEWSVMRASARVRVRTPGSGPSLDVRLERGPVGFNPQLIVNHVERAEARATVEVPLGPFRGRGIGRLGRLTSAIEAPNERLSAEGALILPLGSMQPSLQYRRSGFARPSVAGYFAPRVAETMEAGVYLERGEDGPLSLAADLGAGMQRVAPHGVTPGPWSRAWRAWSQANLALGPSQSWFVELEAYDAPFALDGVGAEGHWRYLSLTTGVRWAIR